jgi:hypothetical protein
MVKSLGANLSGANWVTNLVCGSSPGTGTNPGSLTHPYLTLQVALACTPLPALGNTNGGIVMVADNSLTGNTPFTEKNAGACPSSGCAGNTRMIEVRPYTAGQRYSIGIMAAGKGTWNISGAQMVTFNNVDLNFGTIQELSGCAGGNCVATINGDQRSVNAFSNATFNNPDGPLGPTYGYYGGTSNNSVTTPFNITIGAGTQRYYAVVESTASTINMSNGELLRNVTMTVPWDIGNYQFGTTVTTANTGYFNVQSQSPNSSGIYQLLHQRLTWEPSDNKTSANLPTISNTPQVSGGNTRFGVVSNQGTTIVNGGTINFITGAQAGNSYGLTNYTSGGTTVQPTNAQTTSGAVLTMNSTSGVLTGMAVQDLTTPSAIGASVFVSSIVANTSVTLTSNVSATVGNGDNIQFTPEAIVTGVLSPLPAAGDEVFLWEPAHADDNQTQQQSSSVATFDLNFYGQKFTNYGLHQTVLSQAGAYCPSTTSCANAPALMTTSGTAVTFSSPVTLRDGDFIVGSTGVGTGSISGTTLTITGLTSGNFVVGYNITGGTISGGTQITALGSATGGTGTYTVNNSQTVSSTTITQTIAQRYQYRQVVGDTSNSTSAVINYPFLPDVTTNGITWNQGKTVKNYVCVSCRLGGNSLNGGDEGQWQNASQNYTLAQYSQDYSRFLYRPGSEGVFSLNGGANGTGGGFALRYHAIYDSFLGYGANNGTTQSMAIDGPGWNPPIISYTFDTNNYGYNQAGFIPGTNITTQTARLADGTYIPGVGLTATITGVQGNNPNFANGTPLFPWRADGNPKLSGGLVGAMQ